MKNNQCRSIVNNNTLLTLILIITIIIISLPLLVIVIWSVSARWPWPELLPTSYTVRTIKELFYGSSSILELLYSSVILASLVAIFATIIAIMTSRVSEIYKIKGRKVINFTSMLPILVPGTVFAMGIQVTLIKLGLNDSIFGVVIVHTVVAMPYCVSIMVDLTSSIGNRLEEQAAVLGAKPIRSLFDVGIPQLLPGILSSISMAYIMSYSQYFTTLLAGGGKIKTFALVLVPYIQSGDRALASIYSIVFVGSALIAFFILEALIHKIVNERD